MDRLVDTDWLEGALDETDLVVLDCRVDVTTDGDGRSRFASGRPAWERAHVPGARHADLLGELSDPDADLPLMMPPAEWLADRLGALGVGDGDRVVLYDDSYNMWAARVWWMLRAVGVDRAGVLDGGWTAWRAEERPTAAGAEPMPEPATLTPRPRPGLFLDTADVEERLERPDTCLVDALDPRVYRGERVDYGRPGHIPGAYNVPAVGLVDPDTGRYLPLEQLHEKLGAAPVHAADEVVTYCGGGVAASSVAFALGLIGVEDAAVYDGSLLAWTADPRRPMTTEPPG